MKRFFILLISLFIFIPSVFAGERINVAINIDNKYTTYALLTINSILKNNKSNSDYTFYVLHDGLSWWNKWRMRRFIHKNKQDIEFIKVNIKKLLGLSDNIYLQSVPKYITKVGIARIFLPEVLPISINKCLYIDCDTLILSDLKELYDIDISDYAAAMVSDGVISEPFNFYPYFKHYYNNGLMLINLDYWRKNKVSEDIKKYLLFYILYDAEQEAINVVLREKVLSLDKYWNQLCFINKNVILNSDNKGIVHYVSLAKPWYIAGINVCYTYYYKYNRVKNFIGLYTNYWKKSDLKYYLFPHMYINFSKYTLNESKLLMESLKKRWYERNVKRIDNRNENYNKHPKVSVIVPVYNGKKYIPRQSKCLVNQTFKNFEVIYVNDGSTDNTLEILRKLQNKYKNIRVISQKNQGPGGARNTGLAAARGDYVIFFDVDDTYDTNTIKVMYKKAKETNSDIVVCNGYWNHNGDIRPNNFFYMLPQTDVFSYKNVPDKIFRAIFCCVWDKLYKRQFLIDNDMKFNNLRHGEDLYFVYKSLILAEKIAIVPNYFISYYAYNKNALTTQVNSSPNNSLEAILLLRKFLIQRNIYDSLEQSVLNLLIGSFSWTYDQVDNSNKKILIKKYKPIFKEIGVLDKDITYYYNMVDAVKIKKIMGVYKKTNKFEKEL